MIIRFENNEIMLWENSSFNMDGSQRTQERNLNGIYYLENINDVNFIIIQWENNQIERYLILYNNFLCFLYRSDGYPYFRGFKFRGGASGEGCFSVDYSNVEITASSYLIESNVTYNTGKLTEKIGECWVEGVTGQGINETLYIKMTGTNSIHISTGFISYNRLYLFGQNSRPRKIELSVENKYKIITDLDDTPNFQTINLPEQLEENDILKIKILEVYLGTRYEDTCINTILLDWANY
jgi:hypothetical protein